MTFNVAAEAYDRFMGRYSKELAPSFAELAGVGDGMRVLDVGCGPGALTGELVARVGAANVAAADPSEPFVTAVRERFPGVEVRLAPAEELPYEDGAFDATLAQLVVHFMADPVAGIREMARVTRSGGIVAACVWDMDHAPLTPFWKAAREAGEQDRAGTRDGQLAALFEEAGVGDVEFTTLAVRVEHQTFDEWWEPFTLGVGPAGAYAAKLDDAGREELRRRCVELLGEGPVSIPSRAWAARGRAA